MGPNAMPAWEDAGANAGALSPGTLIRDLIVSRTSSLSQEEGCDQVRNQGSERGST